MEFETNIIDHELQNLYINSSDDDQNSESSDENMNDNENHIDYEKLFEIESSTYSSDLNSIDENQNNNDDEDDMLDETNNFKYKKIYNEDDDDLNISDNSNSEDEDNEDENYSTTNASNNNNKNKNNKKLILKRKIEFENFTPENTDKNTLFEVCKNVLEFLLKKQMKEEGFNNIYRRYKIDDQLSEWETLMCSNEIAFETNFQKPFYINLILFIFKLIYDEDIISMDYIRNYFFHEIIKYIPTSNNLFQKLKFVSKEDIELNEDFMNISPRTFIKLCIESELFDEIDYSKFVIHSNKIIEENTEDYFEQNIDEIKIYTLDDIIHLCIQKMNT